MDQFYLDHLGYASTIIAFYFVPFLLFKGKNLFPEVKNFFLDPKIVLYRLERFLLQTLLRIFLTIMAMEVFTIKPV